MRVILLLSTTSISSSLVIDEGCYLVLATTLQIMSPSFLILSSLVSLTD